MPASDKELIARLPRTFIPALNEQLHRWELLFPAERRLLRAQLDWIASLSARDFQQLFKPIVETELRMNLPRWRSDESLTIEETAIIARSPLYPEWRPHVEKAFERIDAGAEASGELKRVRRLVICVLPPGLPHTSQPQWTDLDEQPVWIRLARPYGEMEAAFVDSLAGRSSSDLDRMETTWVMECEAKFSVRLARTSAIVLSWPALERVRREFSRRLNAIGKTLKSADQTTEELKRIDLAPLLDRAVCDKPAVREFVRSVLLGGNGSLVFNNSFVQWSAAEALRRVQPQVLVASFGIRPKPKPFSSVVWFEDQKRSNPVADEPDLAGSLGDCMMLTRYVHLAAQRLGPYHGRTMTLLAIADLDRVAVIAPKAAPAPWGPLAPPIDTSALASACLGWLGERA